MANKSTQDKKGMDFMNRGPGPGPGNHPGKKRPKPKDTKGTLLRIWQYIKKQKFLLITSIIVVIMTTALGLVGPYLIAKAIDDFIEPGIQKGLSTLLLFMLSIYITSSFLTWLQSYIMVNISQNAVKDMRKDFFNKLQSLSLKFFDSKSNGELMSRVTNDIENINNTLSQGITQLVSSLLTLIGVVIIMLYYNWALGLISMSTVPLIMFVGKFIGKHSRKNFIAKQKSLGELNGMIEETLTGQKVVKAYCKEETVIAGFKATNEELRVATLKAELFGGFMGPSMNMINNLNFVIIAGVGGYMAVKGFATIGMISAYLSYSKQFGRPLTQLANLYNTIQSAIAGAERVFEVMDEKTEIIDKHDAVKLAKVYGRVKFNNVDFGYNKDVKILKNASFTAEKGDMIALVGPTGAGKTTIINLLTRFYDIDSGSITIDGINIQDIHKENLRSKLGIVLQDTYLFSESVRENIRYGRLDATDDEIEKAAKMANAHHFIKSLPNGYDTILSQEGSNLSEGQRQLLAIARAILSDPSILILDEATSSVDTRTESHIQEAMLNLMKGRTSFVIAHRLSTIKNANQILVIENGNIVERGNHESLLMNDGLYSRMYNSQFSRA